MCILCDIPGISNTPNGLHRHKCPSCKHEWYHDGREHESKADRKVAHTCSKCGTEQWRLDTTPAEDERVAQTAAAVARLIDVSDTWRYPL